MCNKQVGIYSIRNTLNGLIYVGKSINIVFRFGQHRRLLDRGKHESSHLQRAWLKYGADSFVFEVIELCGESNLAEREYFHVGRLKSADRRFGYNTSTPTLTGYRHGTETRRKISDGLTGRIVPKHVGDKIRKALIGRRGVEVPFFGKHHSEATKQHFRDLYSHNYIFISPTGEIFHAKGLKGFCVRHQLNRSEMHKVSRGIVLSHKGWTIPNQRASRAKLRSGTMISPDGIAHSFDMINDFCRATGLEQSEVSRVLSGKCRSHRGWVKAQISLADCG